MGAAVAEFKRAGMAERRRRPPSSLRRGVAHGTFFFHFPTKEHVLLELERREEDRIAKRFAQFTKSHKDLASMLREAVNLVMGLERRLGAPALQRLPGAALLADPATAEDGGDHPLIVLVAEQIENARRRGDTDADITAMNSAIYFLLGLYALLITIGDTPARTGLVDDYLTRTLRSMQ